MRTAHVSAILSMPEAFLDHFHSRNGRLAHAAATFAHAAATFAHAAATIAPLVARYMRGAHATPRFTATR
jgi:hypothetical protein